MANVIQCPTHGYFAAGWVVCPECENAPVTLQTSAPQTVTVVRRKQSRGKQKPIPQAGKTSKPLNAITAQKRLQAAGLTDTSMIVSGIQTGAVAGALYNGSSGNTEGVFLAYLAIVDSLSAEYPQIAKYRNRLVSGRAA